MNHAGKYRSRSSRAGRKGAKYMKSGVLVLRKPLCLLLAAGMIFLFGCSISKQTDPMEKIKDLEFTVLAEDDIPTELKTVIDERKAEAFKLTYQDNGFLYICIGYGEQVSGGFSITVNALYLTDNAIYADTTLLGPDPAAETKKKSPSYPYVVLKTEYVDKPVVFD